MTRIYLCFVAENNHEAIKLAEHLEETYAHAFVDGSDPDANWDNLVERIEQCNIFVYLVSPPALANEWWHAQLDEARRLKKPALALNMTDKAGLFPVLGDLAPIDLSDGITRANLAAMDRTLAELDGSRRKSRRCLPAILLLLVVMLVGTGVFLLNNGAEDNEDTADTSETVETASVAPATGETRVVAETVEPVITPTTSATQTFAPTHTHTLPATATITPTVTPTMTLLPTNTLFEAQNTGVTSTPQTSLTATVTQTPSPSRTVRITNTIAATTPHTAIPTATRTMVSTASPTAAASASRTATNTRTLSPSNTPSRTLANTALPTNTPLATDTHTPLPSYIATITPTINPNSVFCPGAPLSQLLVGDTARVIVQTGISLRDEPGLSATIKEYMAFNTEVLVVDGPRCVNGFRWWFVRVDEDSTGWSAEGGSDIYYLEPVRP